MAYWLSEPIEKLIEQHAFPPNDQFRWRVDQARDPTEPKYGKPQTPECEVLVVGSGYGGAVAAMRLADPNRRVIVLERGKEYALGDFPENLGEAPGHIRLQRPDSDKRLGNADALFDFRISQHIAALVGNGLGGGSLINANVAIAPDDDAFKRPEWPEKFREQLPRLRESMCSLSELLGVTTDPEKSGKMSALERLVLAIKEKEEHKAREERKESREPTEKEGLKASCNPAPITVTFAGGQNAVGIHQEPCVRCGNCVTGCNVGAKNTLAMNLLPLAKARGARLYTGATVLSVKREPPIRGKPANWLVRYRRTATEKGPLHDEIHAIRASVVILAAGTFGSTEILLRSQALGDLDCSERLGEGFSGNGDALIFGYGQRKPVGCIASGGSLAGKESNVGPTISGVARIALTETGKNATRRQERRVPGPWPRQIVLEDGAVPIILKRIFAEIVTTGSLIRRHTKDAIPAWCDDHKKSDPLGIHEDALTHSQLLLGMGDDGAPGKLVLVPAAEGGWDDARVTVQWRSAGANLARAFQRSLDAAFLDSEDGGFDGGDYIANPLALPLPEDFDGVLTGGTPPGMQVTVHPLGGCPMGGDSRSGVVDHFGRVRRRRGQSNQGLYDGLYVLDGSIVPVALGVNPFLTIAALADVSARQILEDKKWSECGQCNAPLEMPPRTRTRVPIPPMKDAVHGKFKERLTGRLDPVPKEWIGGVDVSKYSSNDHWLVADIEITIRDIDQLLSDPGQAWPATCVLSERMKEGLSRRLVEGSGTVSFFARNEPPHGLEEKIRTALAIDAFFQRRKPYLPDTDETAWRQLKSFWRVAKNHSHWRSMVYRFTFDNRDAGEGQWVLKGKKELAYEPDSPNVWTTLTQLPVTALLRKHERNATRAQQYQGMLEVDLERLTERAPLQVTGSPNLAETLLAMIGVGMLFLRTLFQTHFWSFPAPDYAEKAPEVRRDPGELRVLRREEQAAKAPDMQAGDLRVSGHRTIAPQTVALAVSNAKDSVQIRLIRYENKAASSKQKVLLIHGLAHGACIFTTDTVTQPLAAYLYDRGFEPWLLEHRLSHALPGTAARPSNMDDIASGDIKTAVDYVYRQNRNEPINVFAHCIGAGAFSMAVLGGHCHGAKGSKIRAAAIHAVPPWVVPSRANRMRANMAAFIKDVIGAGALDPIPSLKDNARWDETLIDRIAASLPMASLSDSKHHVLDSEKSGMSKDICNRMTLFYGREWVHENLDPGTHRQLAGLFGVGNLEVFRHVFFIAQRKRITDHEGRNVYLKEENVRKYWGFPTLFAHGTENQVFDIQSSRRSAIRLHNLRPPLQKDDDPKPKHRFVFLHQVRGYGHMDYIFGREAHIAVYPKLAEFLSDEYSGFDPLPPDLDRVEQLIPPLCGPLIGDAHRGPDGVHLRVWLESDENEAWSVGEPTFTLCADEFCAVDTDCKSQKGAKSTRGEYGLYLVYDVVIPYSVEWTPRLTLEIRLPYESSSVVQRASIDLALPWFKRLKDSTPRGSSFLIGSCRHPGSPFERDLCDKVMVAMLDQVRDDVTEKRQGVDHILLVGDQIYADATADAFDTNEPGERFSARYRDLFQSAGFKDLARSAPIRMAIDDHEISNNWPGRNRPNAPAQRNATAAGAPAQPKAAPADAPPGQNGQSIGAESSKDDERGDQRLLEELENARDAALNYEILAAPGARAKDKLWYEFESGDLSFFVLDCRTQRVQRRSDIPPDEACMFGESHDVEQCKALEKWLEKHRCSEQPKFIVSSIPIAPVLTDHVRNTSLWRNADNWFGYPASLEWLAKLFTRFKPTNVVFLSGDYHFSATAELCFFDAASREASAYQVVSSGLYAPMPFANERFEDYSWDCWEAKQCAGKETRLGFKARRLCNSQSHFVRVDAKIGGDDKWHVDVKAIGADGKEIVIDAGADGKEVKSVRLF